MRLVRCPQCATQVDWDGNPFRPFCSERCRLVDLGAWIDEKYSIPGALEDESATEDPRPRATGKNEHGDDS